MGCCGSKKEEEVVAEGEALTEGDEPQSAEGARSGTSQAEGVTPSQTGSQLAEDSDSKVLGAPGSSSAPGSDVRSKMTSNVSSKMKSSGMGSSLKSSTGSSLSTTGSTFSSSSSILGSNLGE